jgi:hypothetical protein
MPGAILLIINTVRSDWDNGHISSGIELRGFWGFRFLFDAGSIKRTFPSVKKLTVIRLSFLSGRQRRFDLPWKTICAGRWRFPGKHRQKKRQYKDNFNFFQGFSDCFL